MDAAVGMVAGFNEIRAYHLVKRDGKLRLRVWQVLLGDPGRSIVADCHAAGLESGWGMTGCGSVRSRFSLTDRQAGAPRG